ncbi:MAG: 4Fe-4S binding protein [Victivallaceae bacterium]|nr:4Fe-4S binding protein [Victivallaceae bacterium]
MAKYKRNWLQICRGIAAALVLALAGVAFSTFGSGIAPLLHVQFGPALLQCVAASSVGALAIVLGIALFTLLFGRFYCAVLCPFGILQDVIGFLSRRKGQDTRNFRKTRYAIAGIVTGMLVCGWSGGMLLLDPYSNFGRIFASFTVGGWIALIGIILLAVWKGRFYCTTICPVGTLLGILAKHGVFELAITGKCVHCGTCKKVCPAGCIDLDNGTIDNEQCVRCMNCVADCPLHGIAFVARKKKQIPTDESRRAFLVGGGMLLAGVAAGMVLAKTTFGKFEELVRRTGILPPGAGNARKFAAKCTACQLCTANCPAKIIVPAPGGDGPVSLDLRKGACQYNCNRCSQLCPTGALTPLPLEVKQKTKIAEAQFNAKVCIVFQEGQRCGRCAQACPVHAITLRKNTAPRPVDTNRCIGCGACQAVCPATPVKAMTVHEIENQTQLEKIS